MDVNRKKTLDVLFKNKVVILFIILCVGGTIASKRSETGLKPLITSDELLSYVPDARHFLSG